MTTDLNDLQGNKTGMALQSKSLSKALTRALWLAAIMILLQVGACTWNVVALANAPGEFVEIPAEQCASLEGASSEGDWVCGATWWSPSSADADSGELLYEMSGEPYVFLVGSPLLLLWLWWTIRKARSAYRTLSEGT